MTNKTLALSVLLTLANASQFNRRDLTGPGGMPLIIQKGETIRVSEATADEITGEDYINRDGDDNELPYFVPAAEDAKVDHDFTVKPEKIEPEPAGTPTITHDLSSLPEQVPLHQAIANGQLASKPASTRAPQRAVRPSK